MRIWLIVVGEPLPSDGPDIRLYRAGILAGELAQRGHEVTWWTSAFDHIRKRLRSETTTELRAAAGYRIVMLKSQGYQNAVSVQRLWDHYIHTREFTRLAKQEEPPQVILCAMPTIELSHAVTLYGKSHGIPTVIDIRDLWPDIFLDALPPFLRSSGHLALFYYNRMLRAALRRADAVTGITQEMVAWGLDKIGRPCGTWDQSFPLGYPDDPLDPALLRAARKHWQEVIGKGSFIVCFFGKIGVQCDLETVIQAAPQLTENPEIQFVICGEGERRERYQMLAADLPNVLFPGFVSRSEIIALMQISQIGLAPYKSKKAFGSGLPNKPLEYLSGGLPVLSSIDGVLGRLLTSEHCGLVYQGAEELIAILKRLCSNRDELNNMSRNALALYKQRFVAASVYTDMADYLEQLSRVRTGEG